MSVQILNIPRIFDSYNVLRDTLDKPLTSSALYLALGVIGIATLFAFTKASLCSSEFNDMSIKSDPSDHGYRMFLDPPGESLIKKAWDITPENVHEAIPVYKTIGLDRTALLEDVDPTIWTKIIPDLFNWTLDINWPSAHLILPLLRSNPVTIEATIPLVESVLYQDDPRDDEHQWVLINWYVMDIDASYRVRMLPALRFFREHSTPELEEQYEWNEQVDKMIAEAECFLEGQLP